MILYLDTSSLVKLYVEESASADVASLVESAEVTATALIAYAEARASFARRFREHAFSARDYKRLVLQLDSDWQNVMSIQLTDTIVRKAGEYAEKHALRGFDAVHLSSAVMLQEKLNEPVIFSCFDHRLQSASKKENLAQP